MTSILITGLASLGSVMPTPDAADIAGVAEGGFCEPETAT